MSYIVATLFFGIIVAIFIFDFYEKFTGPGTYALRKLTSGKFPPLKPNFFAMHSVSICRFDFSNSI